MTGIDPLHVATVREFSRFYTRRLGTLDEGLLDTPWTLTEARVNFSTRPTWTTARSVRTSPLWPI